MKLNKYEQGAVDWLFRAQDITPDGGISKYYIKSQGWCKESYKEVSGYIIPTLFELFHKTKNKEFYQRAIKIADWEIAVQEKDGKWEYVFDTGQVLLGLTRTYLETKDKKYLSSIIKAANWLVRIQKENGNWGKEEFALGLKNKILRFLNIFGNAHNTRTAWALLEVWKITKDEKYKIAAIKNLNWVLSKQLKNGYYKNCSDYTHYLTYTASGLLESGLILNDQRYINSAKIYTDTCVNLISKSKYFGSKYNKNWKKIGKSHSCLTSDAQLAILLYRLFAITKNKDYKETAKKLINFLKDKQDLTNSNQGIRGGIAGSYPFNGPYCQNTVLSWATKFYIDALLIESQKKKLKAKRYYLS